MSGIEKGATATSENVVESIRLAAVSPTPDSALFVTGWGWGGGLLSRESIVMALLSKRSSRLNGSEKSS